MKRKILSLLTLLCIAVTGSVAQVTWPDANYLVIGPTDKTSSEAGITFTKSDKYTIQSFSKSGTSKFNGQDFTYGLKHESGTSTTFTTTAEATITIVQTTCVKSDASMNLDSKELSTWTNATKTTYDAETNTDNQNIIVYVIPNVAAGTHSIARVSDQPYMLYVGVTNTGAEAAVVDPTISLSGSTLTISCLTDGANIYYTTDGTEPTTESTAYSEPVELTSSCTIRAIAIKGDDSSNVIDKECFIPYSDALAVLQYTDGTADGTTWTADGYVLTASTNNHAQAYGFDASKTAFKLNTTDTYSLKIPDDVKVTKIVVVGKSWMAGTSTVAIEGFDKTGTFYETTKEDEVYTRYIGSCEFTPQTEKGYGETVTLTVGGDQLAAYIVVYGEERVGPAYAIVSSAATWDFTSSSVGTITANKTNALTATSGSGTMSYVAGSSCSRDNTNGLKAGGQTQGSTPNWTSRYLVFKIYADGTLAITTNGNEGAFVILQGASSTVSEATHTTSITTSVANTPVSESLEVADGGYVFIGFPEGKRYIKNVTWTPAVETVTLTTTANMDGWRAFYDASNNYSVDANTKVFVAPTDPVENVLTLKSITGVPAGVPVILKTTADNRTMTLTKAAADTYTYTSDNNLKVADGSETISDKYRLGYGASGVGFYPYSGTPAAGTVYLNVSSAAARALSIAFDDVTGIQAIGKEQLTTDNVYDLSGRRIVNGKSVNGKLQRGLYIVNGKKVVVK